MINSFEEFLERNFAPIFSCGRCRVERLSACIFSSKTLGCVFKHGLSISIKWKSMSEQTAGVVLYPRFTWTPGRNCFEFRAKSDHFYWLAKCLMGLEPGVRFPFFILQDHLIGPLESRCEVCPKHHYVRGKSDGFIPGCVSWLIRVLIHMDMWCQRKNGRV